MLNPKARFIRSVATQREITILAAIAENPRMSKAHFDQFVAELSNPSARKVALLLWQAGRLGRQETFTTREKLAAQALTAWARSNLNRKLAAS